MIPGTLRPPVLGLWVGTDLTPIEQLSIRSFLANGHPYHLFAYDRIAGVPDGTVLRDAAAVIPRGELFLSQGSPAHFSDWFRWKLLADLGGYWADLDVVCLRGFDFSEPVVFGWQETGVIDTAVLRFPAGHALARVMLRRCEAARNAWPGTPVGDRYTATWPPSPVRSPASDQPWGLVGGPYGFTAEVRRAGLERAALPQSCFYAVPHTAWQTVLESADRLVDDLFRDASALHLWNEMFRRHGIDKHASYPASSPIEQLKTRYL